MRHRRRSLLAVLAAGLLVAGAGALYARNWLSTPLPLGEAGTTVEVLPGQSLTTVTQGLAARGLLRHPRLLALYGRLTRADARLHAGEFAIEPGTTPAGLLLTFVSGDVVQHSVTIVEGWAFRDLRRALAAAPTLEHTLEGLSDDAVMEALGEAGRHPEGLFFPDTYLFGKGTRDIDVLRQARERMRRELDAAWEQRHADLPLADAYKALILASIVERETAASDERNRIAGVFVSRLRTGMRLQTDPTIIYGLGPQFDGNLRRADLERDGPYNTYTRAGLPPTPIALPGRQSLRAAVQPDERGELYFVATGLGDGRHTFSKTLQEHNAAVRQYLERYRQQNRASKDTPGS
jgi:UPF0755 protein